MRNMSEKGKKLLAQWEGLRTEIYLDSGGLPTIGIGHLLTEREIELGIFKNGITREEAFTLLEHDLIIAESTVDTYVDVELNQNQFDALVSFVFNLGENAFRRSTLLALLNQGQYDHVPTQLRRWNKVKVDGELKVSQGLINRREKEIALWCEK